MPAIRENLSGVLTGSPGMTVGRPRSLVGGLFSMVSAPIVEWANLPYQPYLPDINNPEPFGLDISMYNYGPDLAQEPDWEALAAYNYPKIEFIYVRGGISWGYIDPTFAISWKALKQYTDIPRSMYHVPYVSQPVVPQVENIEKIFDTVSGDMGEGPIIEDWELHNSQEPTKVSSVMGELRAAIQFWFNWRTDIYSGDWFIRAFAEPQNWMKKVLWLLAHYLIPTYGPHPGPPDKPDIIPREMVAWHQDGSYYDGRVMGIPGNIRVDGNHLEAASGMTSVNQYLVKQVPEPPPEPPPTTGDIEMSFSLNLRGII